MKPKRVTVRHSRTMEGDSSDLGERPVRVAGVTAHPSRWRQVTGNPECTMWLSRSRPDCTDDNPEGVATDVSASAWVVACCDGRVQEVHQDAAGGAHVGKAMNPARFQANDQNMSPVAAASRPTFPGRGIFHSLQRKPTQRRHRAGTAGASRETATSPKCKVEQAQPREVQSRRKHTHATAAGRRPDPGAATASRLACVAGSSETSWDQWDEWQWHGKKRREVWKWHRTDVSV